MSDCHCAISGLCVYVNGVDLCTLIHLLEATFKDFFLEVLCWELGTGLAIPNNSKHHLGPAARGD